ncbi:FMRFamide receptor-like [Mercenaria mercenaria]|uniref:FMRFamide receptor-like n=1 Tax=Mercenaria mercenaria TaxID=6596 RepID=UPI00234E684C|nr:FMRFamide receptor-like [Mercenaria mercenaria]XP_053398768.1 FMRFamide receptor-like [Mercenaria mercenaria]
MDNTTSNFTIGITTAVSSTAKDDSSMVMAEKMHFVTSAVIGTIFVIIGIIGNILSISVWMRPKMRSSTGTYLIGQAIADMGLLVFFFITESVPKMAPEVTKSFSYGVFFSYIGYPIFFLFVICSIWFTVGVTVDRYIQVCWINRSRDMCTVKRALTGLGIITFLCFIINIPHFASFEPVHASDTGFRPTEYGGSKNYEFWVHCMFLVLAPWATIFVLNMLIIQRVSKINRHMNAKRGESGKEKAKKSEAQMTRLLLTVTFTFLVLIAFQCITQCFFMLGEGDHRIVSEAFSIAKLGIVINSSINFFLYCLSAARFRKELATVICARIRGYEESHTSFSMSNSTSSSAITRTKSAVSKKASMGP